MRFQGPLIEGTLLKRYKRFLADVELADGRRVTAHTPNTGSMKGCCDPGARVWLRDTGSTTRKYPLSWELVETGPNRITGINTGLANALVAEAIEDGTIEALQGYANLRREVRFGREGSRVDLLLEGDAAPCYVEVKNVTLVEDRIAFFPDAVSIRASKHLRELAAVVKDGSRGVLVFCIQRSDAVEMRPADAIDPNYGLALRTAIDQGVEALGYRAEVSPSEIVLKTPVPVVCP